MPRPWRATPSNTWRRCGHAHARFADAFFSSTLPTYVLDAISSQLAILRTPTVTRLTDGTLYGFEGCHAQEGCCEGSCTHVWSYTQALAYLFPQLERGMREAEYNFDLRQAGRAHAVPHRPAPGHAGQPPVPRRGRRANGHACCAPIASGRSRATTTGCAGCGLSPRWRWSTPGSNGTATVTGCWRGAHHNTLDIEFHGPETMCGSMYLAALRAGEEMARYLGDEESAREYRRVFASGTAKSDRGAVQRRVLSSGDQRRRRRALPVRAGPRLRAHDRPVARAHVRAGRALRRRATSRPR